MTQIEERDPNYPKATGLEVGLLLNFGGKSLEDGRFVFSHSVQSV
jgi:hypothetical protein